MVSLSLSLSYSFRYGVFCLCGVYVCIWNVFLSFIVLNSKRAFLHLVFCLRLTKYDLNTTHRTLFFRFLSILKYLNCFACFFLDDRFVRFTKRKTKVNTHTYLYARLFNCFAEWLALLARFPHAFLKCD